MSSPTMPRVRVTLAPDARKRRERLHSERGFCTVGGHYFINGRAYLEPGATLVRRLRSGQAWNATVDVGDPDDAAAYDARLAEFFAPKFTRAEPEPERKPSPAIRPGRL